MAFYENYVRLCNSVGKTPSAVALEIGIEKSTVTRWSKGGGANYPTKLKIADYFGCTVDELMRDDLPGQQTEKPVINVDEELNEYLEMLRTRSECRMLLKTVKNATKEEVEANVKFIEAIRGKTND